VHLNSIGTMAPLLRTIPNLGYLHFRLAVHLYPLNKLNSKYSFL
jgi:hypothetical protein